MENISIFANVDKNKKDIRCLLIDGTNQFRRAAATVQTVNKDGIHIGAISGFFMTIGYAIKTIKPDFVVVSFDSKNSNNKRLEMFPEYKLNRRLLKEAKVKPTLPIFKSVEEEDLALNRQMLRLKEYFSTIPIRMYNANEVESDDILAHLVNNHFKEYDNYIMTTDTDYYQLIRHRVTIYNPRIKRFITPENIVKEEGISANNYLYQKSVNGDTGDGIPKIKGIAKGTIKKLLPRLYTDYNFTSIDDLINEINTIDIKSKKTDLLKENIDIVRRNYELIQLTNIILPELELSELNKCLDTLPPRLNTTNFSRMLMQDGIYTTFSNPISWMRDVFRKLDINFNLKILDGR